MAVVKYDEDNIRTLEWKEHIRMRPGMYIGKLGDGSSFEDGIYILLKEILDNCIDEYVMGHGKQIDITIIDGTVKVRDFGRGIPLGKVVDCVSKINTGGKYDNKAFKKSVGLNGVGTKAVNALASYFKVEAYRDGQCKAAEFNKGELVKDGKVVKTTEYDGTMIEFTPDESIFKNFKYRNEYIENQIWNYAYLNAGLRINYNGKIYVSKNGLLDLLERKTDVESLRYPIIHLVGEDIEIVMSHGQQYGEEYYSFVNGQNTTMGGTHLLAYREAIVKTLREFYNKSFDTRDVQSSIIGAISLKVEEPIFESQTKTKLGSQNMAPDGTSIRSFVTDFMKKNLDNYLHKNKDVAEAILKKIQQSERERKEISEIKKLANQRAKKAAVHNKKLRDCRVHLNEQGKKVAEETRLESTIFITEGDSASGSLTKARNVESQAVFSLRGKPLNCYGMTKKVVYQNEELNLLQHALDIEDGIENLRYNRVVISTDADVDGMHIRLLLLTFFLQFFPDLVKQGHLYIFDTPLFRVRDKAQTFYCYNEKEKQAAIKKLRGKAEITRFKGLGEISPHEFEDFIGKNIKLDPVILQDKTNIEDILSYYMGKNTPERQEFIIENLKVEVDEVEEAEVFELEEEGVEA
jgi:topoisomerase IV subunit B